MQRIRNNMLQSVLLFQQILKFNFCFLSPFSRVLPRMNSSLFSNVFLTYAECIKQCYDSEIPDSGSLVSFMSSKCEFVYVDNCANSHITNTKEHFISYTLYLGSDLTSLVNTIVGNTKPANEGTVCWSWRDNNGNISRYDLPGCWYYPNSPVCILSQSQLGLLLNVIVILALKFNQESIHLFSIGIINVSARQSSTQHHICLKCS